MNGKAKEIDIATFARSRQDGAVVVDVRAPFEYSGGHVPGAALIPLASLASRLGEIPKGRPVHVICASGNRSLAAAALLTRAGYDASSVAGGTTAWVRAGHPVAHGRHAA